MGALTAIEGVILEVDVLAPFEGHGLEQGRDGGSEVRRLVVEEVDLRELLVVHGVGEFDSQLVGQLIEELVLVAHVALRLELQALSEAPVQVEVDAEVLSDAFQDVDLREQLGHPPVSRSDETRQIRDRHCVGNHADNHQHTPEHLLKRRARCEVAIAHRRHRSYDKVHTS